MTTFADILGAWGPLIGVAGIIWAAAKIVEGSKTADKVQSEKFDKHDDECGRERRELKRDVNDLKTKVAVLEDRDKG